MAQIWKQLQCPPVRYKSVPLWSWNDKLETKELERQIEEMHKAGIGGFFMHARGGLRTPYMGEEWMAAVRTCIEKCKELGMNPWFYDENGWPSGFADGKIPAKGVEFQQKKLAYEQAPFESSIDESHVIAWYAKTENGYRLLVDEELSTADLCIYYEINPYYIDTLSKKNVRAFIESTYQSYYDQFGEEFAEQLKGVFTDEPQYARGNIPWSFELPAAFMDKNDYSVLEALPALFMDTEGSRKARYDYWSCVTSMFVEAYAKQIGDWCEVKGWSATGHVVDEPTIMQHVVSVGDPMAFYEYLQIPGMDWLGREVDQEPLVPKQVSSVARQLGKKQAITESYGCAGWNLSLSDLKRIGEWQFVHGINMMCQHLQSYTLQGLRKRDYPPSLFYQQPWWNDYARFNDYFARLSMLLVEGKRRAEVLLLHPVRTAWVELVDCNTSEIESYHQSFAQLTRWMCQMFVEHDYGSESIIERHGKVQQGRFIVGEAAYRLVVIPPCVTLNRATLLLLKQFVDQGGQVITYTPVPRLINGERSMELDQLISRTQRLAWSSEELYTALMEAELATIRLTDHQGARIASDMINVQSLKLEGSIMYYIVNSGMDHYSEAQVELLHKGSIQQVNLEQGALENLSCVESAQGIKLQLPLRPGQSYMLKLNPQAACNCMNRTNEELLSERAAEVAVDGDWTIAYADLNSITLDYCRLRVEGGAWSELQPVIFLQEQLLDIGKPAVIEQEFQFEADFDVQKCRQLYLVMEKPEDAVIEVNGKPVSNRSCGWWRDTSFHKVDIREAVSAGTNTIRLKSLFWNSDETYAALERGKQFESEKNKLTFDSELESVYIVGDYAVRSGSDFVDEERAAVCTEGPFVLTSLPRTVQSSDLVRQGFSFFAGMIRLEQTIKLDLTDVRSAEWCFKSPPDAIVSRLLVNGREVHAFVWEPYEADILSYLREGDNVITLEMTNSCRNLLGPHHHIMGEVYKVGPDSYTDKAGWTDKDLSSDTHVYVERYAFVRFGMNAVPIIEMK